MFNVVPWLVIVPCNITAGWLADKLIKGGKCVHQDLKDEIVAVANC